MCRAVNCKTCNKTTWAGCGNHVDAVMSNVLKSNRCTCDRNAPKTSGTSTGNWLSRLFGRN